MKRSVRATMFPKQPRVERTVHPRAAGAAVRRDTADLLMVVERFGAMRRRLATAIALLGATFVVSAQAPNPAPAPPRPAVVGYIPQVADLEKAERVYHELLGLEAAQGDPRARLEWYPTRPFLKDMYAVGGQIRNFIVRVPTSDLQVEPIQWSEAGGKPLHPRLQDPGATRLVLSVSKLDVLVDRLTKGGLKPLTLGGKPIELSGPNGTSRSIMFEDLNGFFVELVQQAVLPSRGVDGSPLPYIYDASVTLTVADLDTSARFIREVLGLEVTAGSFEQDPKRLQMFGVTGAKYREAAVQWPDKTPQVNLIEFSGVDRTPLSPLVADPNSVLIRMNVRDMTSTLAKVKAFPDATIMNVSGKPFVNGRNQWLVVRVPGASTYFQMIGPADEAR
jgi:hypothetical protein